MAKTLDEAKVRRALDKLRAQRDEIATYAAQVEQERDSRVPKADFEKLQGSLRADRHKAAFKQAAKEAKVRDDAHDDLWDALKLPLDSDEPDAEKIAKAVKAGVEKRKYMLTPEDDGGGTSEGQETKEAPKKLPPGEGSGSGHRDKQVGGLKVKAEDLGDWAYMEKNGAAISKASAEGTLTIL